jgi:hypothetical protein
MELFPPESQPGIMRTAAQYVVAVRQRLEDLLEVRRGERGHRHASMVRVSPFRFALENNNLQALPLWGIESVPSAYRAETPIIILFMLLQEERLSNGVSVQSARAPTVH